MSFFIAGAVVVSSVAISQQQKKAQAKAQKQAEKDALEAEKQSRKAEVFADTEGQGQGSLGQISLEVDSSVDEDEEVASSNIRI